MRTLSRSLAVVLAFGLGLGSGLAQDDQSLDQKVTDIVARMDRGGLAGVWDRAVDLEHLGDEAAPAIAKKLDGASAPVKLGIAKALLSMKAETQRTPAIQAAKDVLKGDGSRDEKVAAADLLSLKGTKEECKALDKSLDTFTDPYVKLAVLKALKKRGRVLKAGEMMKELLNSDDFGVRAEAAIRLAECEDFEASKSILNQLKAEPSERGRRAAALVEQEKLMEAAEKTGGLSAKDDVVKFKDKKIEELNEKIKQMEAETAKGGGAMPPGFGLLKEIEEKIGKYYVDEKKASINKLTEDAAKGMVDALDPFSQYMSEKETTSFQEQMKQEYAGIGAVVQMNAKTGFLNIVRPIYGGPAFKAGLRTLDQIIEVEGQTTADRKLFPTVNDLVAKLKGKRHTKVKIKVKHFLDGPDATPVDLEIKRDFIMLQSVRYDMLPGKVGYLQLESFGAKASEEIEAALNELEKQGMRALVFDLRGNPGGYLNQAVEICSKFLAKGKLVVYQQGREGTEIGKRKDFHVSGDDQHPDYPVVILIDENAASASEIVSGALQVHKRADLVGHQTFGKGSVQQIFPVNVTDGKAALRLTIAYYYLPDGRCIHRPRQPQQWRYQELVRSEIERWKQEGNISEAQAKILLDQYKQKPGGVVPDFDVKVDILAADVLKKMALIADAGKFDEYVQKHWRKNTKTFLELVESDGFDSSRYPGFDEWYTELKTDLSKDDVRKFLRVRVRMFAQDELAKILPSDFQEDNQLDAGVWVAYQKLGDDLAKVKGLEFIAKKFPKGLERNAAVAIGKKGPPSADEEDGEEPEAPKKDEKKKDDKKAPEKKEDKKEKKEDF